MVEGQEVPEPGALLRWGSWIYLALAIAAIVWIGLSEGTISLALFFDPLSGFVDLAIGLLVAAALVGLWHLGTVKMEAARDLERSIAKTLGPMTLPEVVTLAVLSGFSEELFFRGAVQSHWGVAVATVLFAVLHLGPGREYRAWTMFALIAGASLGALMVWRGNLLAPVVAHVTVNLVGLARLRAFTAPLASDPS